jgi:hypothetical protein
MPKSPFWFILFSSPVISLRDMLAFLIIAEGRQVQASGKATLLVFLIQSTLLLLLFRACAVLVHSFNLVSYGPFHP